jgi:hypothetical protein
MKKLFIVSSLLALCFANTAVFAQDLTGQKDDQSLSGANLSSNGAPNPFSAPSMDGSAQPQPDTAGQTADDSDSW